MSSEKGSYLLLIGKAVMFFVVLLLIGEDLSPARRRKRPRGWAKKHRAYSHVLSNQTEAPFSKTYAKIFTTGQRFAPSTLVASNSDIVESIHTFGNDDKYKTNTLTWIESSIDRFNEVLFSWNARRPRKGKFVFFAALEHSAGKPIWHKLAEWGANGQKTFGKKSPFVLTSYSRVHMRAGVNAHGFRIKVVAEGGANIRDVHALFACTSDFKKYRRPGFNLDMPTKVITNVPQQSQFRLDHPRYKDLCSPTSTSMIVRYFAQKNGLQSRSLAHDAVRFADKVHDNGLNIYGNYPLSVAQAYDSVAQANDTLAESYNASEGNVFFRAERLHGPKHLHSYLMKDIPVAVSVRGQIPGAAHPYRNGHFIVIVGWDNVRKRFLCIDPAFRVTKKLLTSYAAKDFLAAWRKSQHLAYIAIPKTTFGLPQTTPRIAQEAERLLAEREEEPCIELAPEDTSLSARADLDFLGGRGIVV